MYTKCRFVGILFIKIAALVSITSYMVLYVSSMYEKTEHYYSSQLIKNTTVTNQLVWKGMYLFVLLSQTCQWNL